MLLELSQLSYLVDIVGILRFCTRISTNSQKGVTIGDVGRSIHRSEGETGLRLPQIGVQVEGFHTFRFTLWAVDWDRLDM